MCVSKGKQNQTTSKCPCLLQIEVTEKCQCVTYDSMLGIRFYTNSTWSITKEGAIKLRRNFLQYIFKKIFLDECKSEKPRHACGMSYCNLGTEESWSWVFFYTLEPTWYSTSLKQLNQILIIQYRDIYVWWFQCKWVLWSPQGIITVSLNLTLHCKTFLVSHTDMSSMCPCKPGASGLGHIPLHLHILWEYSERSGTFR